MANTIECIGDQLLIPTPFAVSTIDRIERNEETFSDALGSIEIVQLDPTIIDLARPSRNPDFRRRMGANIALRSILDNRLSQPVITRLGRLMALQQSEQGNFGLIIAATDEVVETNGTYKLRDRRIS